MSESYIALQAVVPHVLVHSGVMQSGTFHFDQVTHPSEWRLNSGTGDRTSRNRRVSGGIRGTSAARCGTDRCGFRQHGESCYKIRQIALEHRNTRHRTSRPRANHDPVAEKFTGKYSLRLQNSPEAAKPPSTANIERKHQQSHQTELLPRFLHRS